MNRLERESSLADVIRGKRSVFLTFKGSSIGGTELTSFFGGGNLIKVRGGNKLTSLTS